MQKKFGRIYQEIFLRFMYQVRQPYAISSIFHTSNFFCKPPFVIRKSVQEPKAQGEECVLSKWGTPKTRDMNLDKEERNARF